VILSTLLAAQTTSGPRHAEPLLRRDWLSVVSGAYFWRTGERKWRGLPVCFGYPITAPEYGERFENWSGPVSGFERGIGWRIIGSSGVLAGRLGAQVLEACKGGTWQTLPRV